MNYEHLSLLQAVKRWPRVTLISLGMTLNVLLWGFDTGIVGGMSSLVAFRKVFGTLEGDQWIIPVMWLSLWAVAFPIGTMAGATAGGWLQDRTGRKSTLGIGCVLSAGAVTICYLSDRTPHVQVAYFGGKLTQGIAVGILICSTQTYLSEVVPGRLRGPIMALFPASQLVGQLLAHVVVLLRGGINGKSSYRVAILSEYPLSAIPLILAVLVPESPVWLLRQNKTDMAQACFRKIHGAKVAAQHQDLFEEMSRTIAEEAHASNDRNATYTECFRGPNLKRTLIVVFANGMSEIMGMNVLGSVSYFLQLLGIAETPSFILAIVGITLGLAANVGSFWTLLKFGRRNLILWTLSSVSLIWLTIGIAGIFSGTAVGWYAAAGMMAIVFCCGIGCWPASFVVAAETSALRLRSKTSGVGWLLGGLIQAGFGVGTPFLYNPDALHLGGKTGFVFFATALVGVVITYLFVPELKGKNALEIDKVFTNNGPFVFRAAKEDWESVHSTDKMPLNQIPSEYQRYDVESLAESIPCERTVSGYEPLRERTESSA